MYNFQYGDMVRHDLKNNPIRINRKLSNGFVPQLRHHLVTLGQVVQLQGTGDDLISHPLGVDLGIPSNEIVDFQQMPFGIE